MNHTEIQLKLSLVGETLTSVEIALVNQKRTIISIHLEHPIFNFLRILQVQESSSKLGASGAKLLIKDSKDQTQVSPSIEEVVENQESKAIQLLGELPAEAFSTLITELEEGLKVFPPELCEEGVNGTYFLKNTEGKILGVFKPQDEEINSANNPKASDETSHSIHGIIPGEASLREVAAFVVDSEGFFGVPRTAVIQLSHSHYSTTKIGSLQEYVENDGASWDIGPAVFPAKEVHKIGILDLYILNMDRHGGNILFKKTAQGYTLIPIDHGFSLPDTFSIPSLWFEWMTWPQAKKPFDQETRNFIDRIDIERDVSRLRKLGIREECLTTMKITGSLLKRAASSGLSLYEIASVVARAKPDEPSELEKLVAKVKATFQMKSDEFLTALLCRLKNSKKNKAK